MTTYLSTAFSLQMLPEEDGEVTIKVRRVTAEEARELLSRGFVSVVGHELTAAIASSILGMNVAVNRAAIKLGRGDVLVVFQLLYGRLNQTRELTKQEVDEIINKGLYAFFMVTIKS